MKKLLYILCALTIVATPKIYPAGKTTRGTGVSNNTLRTIHAFLNLDPTAATTHEFQQKQNAAQLAIAALPERLRAKYQAEWTKKQALARPMAVASASRRLPMTNAQPPVAAQSTTKATLAKQTIAQEDDETSGLSSREIIGGLSAIALILGYEFLLAPKLNTKQLGIASFCSALLNGQNPFTARPASEATTPAPQPVVTDGAAVAQTDSTPSTSTPTQSTVAQANQPQPNGPGFFKKLGFDFVLSAFGL